jgi:hypothetical protein
MLSFYFLEKFAKYKGQTFWKNINWDTANSSNDSHFVKVVNELLGYFVLCYTFVMISIYVLLVRFYVINYWFPKKMVVL